MLPGSVRVTLELDREVAYREERLAGPSRLFFDLKNVQLTPALMDKVLTYGSDVVNKIRVGRHPDNTVASCSTSRTSRSTASSRSTARSAW